jgi:hypothetical protein
MSDGGFLRRLKFCFRTFNKMAEEDKGLTQPPAPERKELWFEREIATLMYAHGDEEEPAF